MPFLSPFVSTACFGFRHRGLLMARPHRHPATTPWGRRLPANFYEERCPCATATGSWFSARGESRTHSLGQPGISSQRSGCSS